MKLSKKVVQVHYNNCNLEYLELVFNWYIAGKIVVLMLVVDAGNITIKHILVSVMYFIHLLFLCGLVVSSIFLIEHFQHFFQDNIIESLQVGGEIWDLDDISRSL